MPTWRAETIQGGSTPLLRRRQLMLTEHSEGVDLVSSLLTMKLDARIDFLRKLASNRRNDRGDALRGSADQISAIKQQISGIPRGPIYLLRPRLLGYEGTAGRIYFSALSEILPPEAGFSKRGRGGEAGPFNQMLNYGYGVFYRELLNICTKNRLDPYIGVMHMDSYNKPTLVFDLIEPFRANVGESVCKLFSRRQICTEKHFVDTGKETVLSKAGKELLLTAIQQTQKGLWKRDMETLVSKLAKGLQQWNV